MPTSNLPVEAIEAPPAASGLAALALALVYALIGVAALSLATAPGNASPLYPSTGIALAAVLVYGKGMLPGVFLGSLVVELTWSAQWDGLGVPAWTVAAAIALGSTLQAWVGDWLVRRYVRQPLLLGEPRDVALFFGLGAVLACTVSASVSTVILGWAGIVKPDALQVTWLTWWSGDTVGVMVAAPIALTLIGRPRAEWASRRLTVGLTLVLAAALIAAGITQVARWDDERQRNAFDRDADNAMSAFRAQLQEPLHALEALRGVYIASDNVTGDELHRATLTWLEPGRLLAMGWAERVLRSDLPAYEASVRAQDVPDYRVFDRTDATPADHGAPARDDVLAVRHIEPMSGNAAALGVNSLSIPVARAAIEQASRTGLPAATAGFRLTQQDADKDPTGVVIYAPLYVGAPMTGLAREKAVRGMVFVSVRVDRLVETLATQLPRHLMLCVLDADPSASRRRLAGPPPCEATASGPRRVQAFAFAGRQWELSVHSEASALAVAGGQNAWLFALVGLLAVAMLGALLLTVTGRARKIEEAVHTRTAALQSEIVDRERAQAALQESEQRFRNILDNVPIGIVYADLRGRVIKANPRFCELTGYSEAEMLSMRMHQMTHPDDVAQDMALAVRMVNGDIPSYRRQQRCVTRDGRTVWVEATVSLLRDAHGQPRHIVGALQDITERLQLQGAESARELAEASNRAKSDFLSRMSHELRTPLNAILGFAQLLELDRRQPLAPGQRPWVSQIQQAGWHLLEMINDVLDLSRIDSGNLRLQSEALDLADLISAAVPLVKAEADQRNVSVSTDLGLDAMTVLGDATRIRQIMINLLSNAVKYNVDGGQVMVTSRLLGLTEVEVRVSDSGIGMTPEQVDKLFMPFNRLGRENSTQEGTGIGLVISKSLAELMGGTLTAIPAPGGGMTFTLTLPVDPGPRLAATEAETLPPAAGAPYGERVVLYIEDNETNVEVMRGILLQRPQVRLVAAPNGAQGLAAAADHRPDMILLDMHLPDLAGLELLQRLKTDPITAQVPVLAVSADAMQVNIDAALKGGAMGYLTKPISVAGLLEVLDKQLLAPR